MKLYNGLKKEDLGNSKIPKWQEKTMELILKLFIENKKYRTLC